jgi:hypothetical protein
MAKPTRKEAAIELEKARQTARETARVGRGASADHYRVVAAEYAYDEATRAEREAGK